MTDKNLLGSIPATSMNLTEHSLEQLKALFPNVFTEGKVDFDALKAELGDHVEAQSERYQFTWAGKEQAKRIATTPSLGTLRPVPEESVNWDETENLYIEGDNLEVLKLLQKSYFNKVKMIYIDPPYNTGKDFVYKDDFKDNLANYRRLTGQRDEEGNPLFTNSDTAGRYHSNWLSMMYPRLKLARNLLRDDGVIFISIDDTEVHNLRKICDEIFGEGNFVANIVWQKKYAVSSDDPGIGVMHDHILVYSKSVLFRRNLFPRTAQQDERYKNPDDDPRGRWASDNYVSNKSREERPTLWYPILHPKTKEEVWPEPHAVWRYTREKHAQLESEGRLYWGPNNTYKRPRLKRYLNEVQQGIVPPTWWPFEDFGHNDEAQKETAKLLSQKVFSTPKPVRLLKKVLMVGCADNDIVLDFFSGSATTAHAVMELNAEGGGSRKFIMVQIPEPTPENSGARGAGYSTISEIGKERIRRAAQNLRVEYPDVKADFGFKVLKLDTSNIKKWQPDHRNLEQDLLAAVNNIVDGRTSEDLLYEVLIKYGLPLTLPVEKQQVAGHTVYNVAGGSLVACFDEGITLDAVQAIIGLSSDDMPILRIVFRDTSFADDIVKTNAIQRFKQAGINDVLSI